VARFVKRCDYGRHMVTKGLHQRYEDAKHRFPRCLLVIIIVGFCDCSTVRLSFFNDEMHRVSLTFTDIVFGDRKKTIVGCRRTHTWPWPSCVFPPRLPPMMWFLSVNHVALRWSDLVRYRLYMADVCPFVLHSECLRPFVFPNHPSSPSLCMMLLLCTSLEYSLKTRPKLSMWPRL
jgi:hypothetical protein